MNSSAKKKNQPVKVYVRQRPFTEHELEIKCPNIIQHMTNHELIIKSGLYERKYGFDRVFDEKTSQQEVYDNVVDPLIDFIISGYNCTVFAYGQTGTGKTYTMIGDQSDDFNDPSVGLIPRAVTHLFDKLSKIDSKIEFTVRVSFIEIYNEEVRDLLVTSNTIPLKIFEDPENKGSICLKGLTEATVFNVSEVCEWLNIGLLERQTAATNMNRQSSRSHSIFTISVLTRQLTVDGDELIKTGKLYLVDLAGSENIGRSGSTELRAREAGNINKSLLTLGKVIKALALKAQHIPYRDSKLTRILQDSLGGKTKTSMIATISAAANVWDETISTLDYAQVARNVSNCPQVNENRKQANILKDLKEEIGRLRKELAAARTGEGFYISQESYQKLLTDLNLKQNQLTEQNNKTDELLEKIQKLENDVTSKQKEMEDLSKTLNETRLNLSQKSFIIERNDYVLNYLEKRETELSTNLNQYQKLCELASRFQEVFHKKYQNQCDVTLRNATAAKNICDLLDISLKTFLNTTNSFEKTQTSALHQIQDDTNTLKEISQRICEEFLQVVDNTQNSDRNLNIDSKLYTEELDSYFQTLTTEQNFQTYKNALEDVEKYNETKMEETKLMATRCVNIIKQTLNDFTLSIHDVMKTEQNLIKNVMNINADNEIVFNNRIHDCKQGSSRIINKLTSVANDNINRLNTEILAENRNQLTKAGEIKKRFLKEIENRTCTIFEGVQSALKSKNKMEGETKALSETIMENVKKELKENVQFVAHSGDTPAKQIHVYPNRIDEKLPKVTLYREFESLVSKDQL